MKKFIPQVILLLVFGTVLVPNFGALDKIGPQWLYLSLSSLFLLLISIIFIDVKDIKIIFKNKFIRIYLLFLITCSLSIYKSINKPESIITFTQYSLSFITLILFSIVFISSKNKSKIFQFTLITILLLESFFVFKPILIDLINDQIAPRSPLYMGLTSNINVASFSLLIKFPILLFVFIKSESKTRKVLNLIIQTVIIFSLFILGSRASIIGLIFIYGSTFLYLFLINYSILKNSILLLPLFFSFLLSNKALENYSDNQILNRAASISFNTNDGSVNQRVRFYKQALSSIFENPLFGIGLGNWKLYSIKYDKENIKEYIIPYHAHNDFLQVASENGIIASLLYLSIFILVILKSIKDWLRSRDSIFFFGVVCVSIYLLDAMFNFPIARPISQINLMFLLSFFIWFNFNKND